MTDSKPISIRTILWAGDFSETAGLALQHASSIARSRGARLILSHVVEPTPNTRSPNPPRDEVEVHDAARARLDEIAANLSSEQIHVEIRVEQGKAGPSLIHLAQQERVDLIVMGTRGLSGLRHVLLGSTAEYVVRRSECPVMTIHPGDSAPDTRIKLVVLPTDLSTPIQGAAATFSALFSEDEKAKILLTYADRTPPYLEPFRHDTLQKMNEPDIVKDEIEQRMEEPVGHLQEAGFEVETLVLDGDPVSVVTELARDREADMIVMYTHGHSAMINALLGKTAQRIVQHAECPVLTIRPKVSADAD